MFGLLGDLVKIVAAPILIAESIVRPITAPIAEVLSDVADSVQEALDVGTDNDRRR